MSKKAYKRNQGGYAEGPLSGCLYGLTYSPLGSLIWKYRVNNSITLSTSVEMIFDYCNDYTYSPAGRLLTKNVTSTRLSSSVAGTLYNVDYSNNYTYPTSGNVFGVKNVYDGVSGTQTDMNWDANGNLISTSHDNRDKRLMCWTEDNRLQAYSRISDDEGNMAAWYNYNAGGDRNFKLTTPQTRMRQNADVFRSGAALAYPTLYASSLVTVNKNGYTKHYFEGSRRVCSKIGGGFASVDQQYTDSQMPEIAESYFEQYVAQNENLITTFSECLGVNPQLDVYHDLYDVIMHEHGRNDSEPAFFYHSDHLGSAAYLTNDAGQVTQTLNYLPYGEDWVDIQNFAETQYPRLGIYSFNGKEKDYESGYHYYGARYYWSEVLTGWLSVDPMMDKYPSMSPYNYCAWNPVRLVDPEGMEALENADWYKDAKGYVHWDANVHSQADLKNGETHLGRTTTMVAEGSDQITYGDQYGRTHSSVPLPTVTISADRPPSNGQQVPAWVNDASFGVALETSMIGEACKGAYSGGIPPNEVKIANGFKVAGKVVTHVGRVAGGACVIYTSYRALSNDGRLSTGEGIRIGLQAAAVATSFIPVYGTAISLGLTAIDFFFGDAIEKNGSK